MGNILVGSIMARFPAEPLEREHYKALIQRNEAFREFLISEEKYRDSLVHLRLIRKSLSSAMTKDDIKTLFCNLEDIYQLTCIMFEELCLCAENDELEDIGRVFLLHRLDLTLYTIYSLNLKAALAIYDDIQNGNDEILRTVLNEAEKCTRDGSTTKSPDFYKPYTLKALLQEPATRCVHYIEQLKRIGKYCSDFQSEEYFNYMRAADAIGEVNMLTKICERDKLNYEVIQHMEGCMVNMGLGIVPTLAAYGRLRKYGMLTVQYPNENEMQARFCLVFDKILILTAKYNRTYLYDRAILLDHYDLTLAKFNSHVLMDIKRNFYSQRKILKPNERKKLLETLQKYRMMFYLDAKDFDKTHLYFIRFIAPSHEKKDQWVTAIKAAIDNSSPPDRFRKGHRFYMHSFDRALPCDMCGRLMKGLYWQGYVCSVTRKYVHKHCIAKVVKHNVESVDLVAKRNPRIRRRFPIPRHIDNQLMISLQETIQQNKDKKERAWQQLKKSFMLPKAYRVFLQSRKLKIQQEEEKLEEAMEYENQARRESTDTREIPPEMALQQKIQGLKHRAKEFLMKRKHNLVLDPAIATRLCYDENVPKLYGDELFKSVSTMQTYNEPSKAFARIDSRL